MLQDHFCGRSIRRLNHLSSREFKILVLDLQDLLGRMSNDVSAFKGVSCHRPSGKRNQEPNCVVP